MKICSLLLPPAPAHPQTPPKSLLSYGFFESSLGTVGLASCGGRLVASVFCGPEGDESLFRVLARAGFMAARRDEAALTRAAGLLRRLATGEAAAPPPLLLRGTPFQLEVWSALARIPRGETVSYRQLAEALGRPQAARAIGQAVGANPLGVFIPCHRVVTSSGAPGGYAWGCWRKEALLQAEAAPAPALAASA